MKKHNRQTLLSATIVVIAILAFEETGMAQVRSVVPTPYMTVPGLAAGIDEPVVLVLPRDLLVECETDQALFREHLEMFAGTLNQLGQPAALSPKAANDAGREKQRATIRVVLDESLATEAYRLVVDAAEARVVVSHIKGLSHATATLLQMIGHARSMDSRELEAGKVQDQPDSGYRSLMVDMGRNPHSLQLLKETIDMLWFYKVDSLHLHLTDDQRFAFPSTAFPDLWDGLISREQFVDLERYAAIRGVSIIPELEAPGHSTLLCKKYPAVFGKSSTEVAELESSRKGLKQLISEMSDVFSSSPYFHIGGDEAYGVPLESQRSLINELNQHVKSIGKTTIVWEGPPAGDDESRVDSDVIHMNWRTINYPADQMLADGLTIINAAWDPLYIVDHYPRNNFTMASPQHIYESLEKGRFKHFNPDIATWAKPVQASSTERIIGYCMPWWEGREDNYFPLVTPRVIPMAEIAWVGKASQTYAEFEKRVVASEAIRFKAFYPVTIRSSLAGAANVFVGSTVLTFESGGNDRAGQIRFTTDGSQPGPDSPIYETNPIVLNQSTIVRAGLFHAGRQIGHGSRRKFVKVEPVENLALNQSVTTSVPDGPVFCAERLTDGGTGNLDYFLGYSPDANPIEITIDLQSEQQVSQIVVHTYQNAESFESYQVQVSSDGDSFETVADRTDKPESPSARIEHSFQPKSARYIRILTHGHKGQVFDSFSRITEVQAFR